MSTHTNRFIRSFEQNTTGDEWWSSPAAFLAVDLNRAGPLVPALCGIIEVLQEGQDAMWVVGGETLPEGVAVAQEWLDAGVDGADVGGWLRAGCWDPTAARNMTDAGLQPGHLLTTGGTPAHWIEAPNGDDMPVASAVADGFITVNQALRLTDGQRQNGMERIDDLPRCPSPTTDPSSPP